MFNKEVLTTIIKGYYPGATEEQIAYIMDEIMMEVEPLIHSGIRRLINEEKFKGSQAK